EERATDFERRPLPPADRGKQWFLELLREHEQAIAGLLTPAQQVRLKQIALQQMGARAFQEPEVVARLKLTAEQRARIRELEGRPGFGPPPGPPPGPAPGPLGGRGGTGRTRTEL